MTLLSYFGHEIVRDFIVAQVTLRECSIPIKISFVFSFVPQLFTVSNLIYS